MQPRDHTVTRTRLRHGVSPTVFVGTIRDGWRAVMIVQRSRLYRVYKYKTDTGLAPAGKPFGVRRAKSRGSIPSSLLVHSIQPRQAVQGRSKGKRTDRAPVEELQKLALVT